VHTAVSLCAFNAMLQNIVEWIFSIITKCFRIIQLPPEYDSEIQSHIPPALCFIHNVIWIHDLDDLLDNHHVDSDEWSTPFYSGTLADRPPTEVAHTHCHAWYELYTMTYMIRNIEGDD
jgi:hypothetical protein